MKGLFLKYESESTGSSNYILLSGYCFSGGDQKDCSDRDNYITSKETEKTVLLCACGSNDWNEDGRFINEYACNGCGNFIVAHER